MKRTAGITLALACLTVLGLTAGLEGADEAGFESLFNGQSLEGWDGNPELWSVREGVITGQTTAEKPTKGNTFLIWRKGEVSDFELRCEFRIVGGNSGVQYRSKEVSQWVMSGYQADFDSAGVWTGSLYEEKARGVLAKRGNKVVATAEGKLENAGQTASEKEILDSVKKEDWNSYTIIAQGNHLVQKLNDITTVDFTDSDSAKRAEKGLLALQLHAGPPMLVQFRNIRLKKVSGGQ
jgi:hypothetical protein